jgi:hypothetical protein
MNRNNPEPCELAEVIHKKPLSGEYEEIIFGSDRGNTLWVLFSDKDGCGAWIGKFGTGNYTVSKVTKAFPPDKFLVSAGGFAYLIDATNRKVLNQFCEGFIHEVVYDAQENRFIITDGIRVRFIQSDKQVWASRRIALDGIRNLKIEGRILKGLAVVGFEGEEDEFTLDLDCLEIKCSVDFSSWDNLLPNPSKKKSWWKFW